MRVERRCLRSFQGARLNRGTASSLTETSLDVVAKLDAEIVAVLRQPDANERLSREGAGPVGSSPREFGLFIQSEIEKWRKVTRTAGIQPT